MPTLIILRHGKSAYPEGVDDHDRPLNERGQREAAIAGQRIADSLATMNRTIDRVLVSSASRAQQTWQAIAPGFASAHVETREDLYLCSREDLLATIATTSQDVECVLVVGHNDGLENFASWLSGVPVTLKTSTYAIVSAHQGWADWSPGTVSLNEVVVAR